MKTYEALYEPEKNKGVYGISLVKNPAMEGFFVALSKEEKIQLKTLDEEKRILVGLVLEPNKPIYRNQNGEEFNIVFSEQTVQDLCYGFTKNKHNSNSTIEHNENKRIEGVTFVENWLVRDEKMDTTVALGIECKKGSWISVMKVDSPEIWDNYIKTGQVQGFSIDAMLSLKEVNLKSEIEMSKQDENSLIQFLKDLPEKIAIAMKGQSKIELGEIKSADGNVTIMFDGETMEVGGKVWVWAEDQTEVPLPVGDYELEDGRILVVAEEGIIAEVKEPTVEEEATAQTEQAPAEMTAEQTKGLMDSLEKTFKSIMIKYSEEQKNSFEVITKGVEQQLSALKAELKADYDKQILELSSQPAAKPVKSAPQMTEPKNAKERLLQTIQNQH